MKVLYWAPYVGHVGTIKAVINSARAFKRYGGHEVTLIRAHSEWEGSEQTLDLTGIKLHDFGLKKYLPRLARTTPIGSRVYMLVVAFFGFFQLYWYIRRHRPDLIIANLLVVPAILCTRLFRSPPRLVISIQGFPKFLAQHASGYPGWMRVEDALRKFLWNRLYNHADLLVCMTPSTRERLIRSTSLSPGKLVVINNPVVDDDIHDMSRAAVDDPWLFDADRIPIVAIGRLTAQKDFHSLIRAVEIARRQLPIRVAVLGDGELKAELRAAITSLGLQDHVRLYGFVANPYAYLSRARLFVLTSLWEDPGHAILEAAALRVPIVSTDCPSGPAALLSDGAAGALCPCGDHQCLAERIVAMLSGNVEQMVRLAYDNARSFSLEAHYSAFRPFLERSGVPA